MEKWTIPIKEQGHQIQLLLLHLPVAKQHCFSLWELSNIGEVGWPSSCGGITGHLIYLGIMWPSRTSFWHVTNPTLWAFLCHCKANTKLTRYMQPGRLKRRSPVSRMNHKAFVVVYDGNISFRAWSRPLWSQPESFHGHQGVWDLSRSNLYQREQYFALKSPLSAVAVLKTAHPLTTQPRGTDSPRVFVKQDFLLKKTWWRVQLFRKGNIFLQHASYKGN